MVFKMCCYLLIFRTKNIFKNSGAIGIYTHFSFMSGYALQAFTMLRFTSLRSGLSAPIRHPFSSISLLSFCQTITKNCRIISMGFTRGYSNSSP